MRIISGMHRSGTSLIARLFYEAGADMGDPDDFYPADRWNTDGYFEQPDIHAVNMPLINGRVGRLAYFWLPSTKTILRRAKAFEDEIRAADEKYRDSVVKETRFSLTLPAWLKYGAHVERILVCLREPIRVARSIQKRNHTLLRHGFYMWRVHNERLLENAGSIPLWFVSYERVLDAETNIAELTDAFRFMGCDIPEARIAALARTFVQPTMNHNRETWQHYPKEVAALWADLQQRHAAQNLAAQNLVDMRNPIAR